MRRIRLVIDEGPPHYQMAVDEAILLLRGAGVSPDTLRLYVFNPSSVTIGYFQSLRESVNLSYVKEAGIPVVRRVSGGGSVYHDSCGEVTYAVILPAGDLPSDYVESFKLICEGVVRAARKLGCNARFAPLNDVVSADGRKFSGSAQARRLGAVLQHGTFMYATDVETLARCLSVPKGKYSESDVVNAIMRRVTTVSACAGRPVSRGEAIQALREGFAEALDAELVEGRYLPAELELAKSLAWKYRSGEWLELRP